MIPCIDNLCSQNNNLYPCPDSGLLISDIVIILCQNQVYIIRKKLLNC